MSEGNDGTKTGIDTMNIDQLIEMVSDAVVEEIKHGTGDQKPHGRRGGHSDADYMKAVESGDLAAVQKMVDDTAKSAGYTIGPVYHGSVSRDVSVFDPSIKPVRGRTGPAGVYFTSNRLAAGGYTRPPGATTKVLPGGVTSAYLKIQNPLDITSDIKSNQKQGMTFTQAKMKALEKLDVKVHDGVVFKGDNYNSSEYIAFVSHQIKSAAPVTKDSNGKVIPLSQRFNPKESDIRKSDSPPNTPFSLSNLLQAQLLSETLGLGQVFRQGLVLEGKAGNPRSGNHGHPGRPGHVGGSGSGRGEASGLFGRSDQEIKDIESKQEVLNKDVFDRKFTIDDAKDFGFGGRYQKITEGVYGINSDELKIRSQEYQEDIIRSNHKLEGVDNTSNLTTRTNKFDSQNALYDKLKDNKDFNEYCVSRHQPFERGKDLYTWSHGLNENQYNEEVKKKTIRDLVDQWAGTSGDTDPKAIAMQIAAQKLFGTGEMGHLVGSIDGKIDLNRIDPHVEYELKFNPGRKAFLQAQYDATQDYLKKNNIKEMILYRGHEGKRSKLDGGNDVEVNLQPLSSFSMDVKVAVRFAVSADKMQLQFTATPSVIAAVVPAKKIFALPNTGIGCTGEKEVVVLGGKTKSTVIVGMNKIGEAFNSQTLSAVDFKRNLTPKDTSSYPALNALLEGKSAKKDIPNLDEDLENADWTKRSWDLPEFGSVKFDEFLAASGMTLGHFKKLPVYKWMIESGLKVGKSIGLGILYKHLPGQHDQQSHGGGGTGSPGGGKYNSSIKSSDSIGVIGLKGLAAEARKCDTFDDFRKSYLVDIKHGLYWHITYDEDFKIDPEKGPTDQSSMARGEMSKGKLMVTSDLPMWASSYGSSEATGGRPRGYAAIIDLTNVPKKSHRSINRGFGNEFMVDDLSRAKVVKTVTLQAAKRLDRQYDKFKPRSNEELQKFYDEEHLLVKSLGLSMILKGGHGSGIKGHRTYREVNSQKTKNLQEIAKGKAKRTAVEGAISTTNIKDVIKNMRNEADLYTDYLAPDTAVRMRDFISSYESILYEGTRNKEFKAIQAKDLDDFGIDAVQKMMHQEIESNRLSFTDHGIRHLEGNTQRQLELLDQMGNPSAMDKLSAIAIMTNHDMGYTIKSVRDGGDPGGGVHQKASGEMFDEQKSQWNEDKIFTEKQFNRISEAIKTHDSTEFSHDNLLTSTRISDNLALFAKEKLPSIFKYVKGGSSDLVAMGKAASKKDNIAFESARNSLYKKIEASPMNENLKRDLRAGTATINLMTPKFSLGVLAGEISSIKGDKKGHASIEIQYSAWDSFLQGHFDMGQKQTKKLLGDYGVTDFTQTDYDLGGVLKLKVVGTPSGSGKKAIGLGVIFKHRNHPAMGPKGGGREEYRKTRDLRSAATLNGMNFIDSHKISYMSKAYIKNEDFKEASISSGASEEHIAAAKTLVDAIRNVKTNENEMFRSLQFDPKDSRVERKEMESKLQNAKVGDEISFDRISSFSSDRNMAAFYTAQEENALSNNYELKVIGPHKSISTDEYTGMKHKEQLTQGMFKVIKINKPSKVDVPPFSSPVEYLKTITLKQIGVF